MELSNLPGVSYSQAVEGLTNVLERAKTAQNISGSFAEKYDAYCKWAMDSVQILSFLITQDSVARIVTTARHWSLVERPVVSGHEGVGVLYLLNTELNQRIQEISLVITNIQKVIEHWQYHDGKLFVPDTNVFLHEEQQFDQINWRDKVRQPRMVDMHLIVPILVIRELDKAKRFNRSNSVSATNSMEIRTRARQTLKRLNELLTSPDSHAYLSEGESLGPGSVSISLLLNDIEHVGLSDPDSEILDRALTLQQMTGREVTVLTRDTAMSFTARNSGLKSILLPSQED